MIPLASPDIREADIARCNEVLRSGQLVQGAGVAAFEQALARFAGFGECTVVSSGTAALHLALLALGIGRDDAVLVADFTFPATANAVENVGGRCLFCDVDPGRYVVTPERVEACLARQDGDQVKAIIVVHEFGYPAEIERICRIAHDAGILVVEDAACALGTVADGRHVGYHGDAACFSFHPRKAITTGEGGAVLCRDPALTERLRYLRNHGIVHAGAGIDFTAAGLNYRMTDFQAALAPGQLERYAAELQRRRELASLYTRLLAGDARITLPIAAMGHSWQSFMVVLDPAVDRGRVIARMRELGVESNLGAQALHRLAWFGGRYAHAPDAFPVASRLYDSGLVLPLYGRLEERQVEYIAQTLSAVLDAPDSGVMN